MNAHANSWKPVNDAMRERWIAALRRDDLSQFEVNFLTKIRRADQISWRQLGIADEILRKPRRGP